MSKRFSKIYVEITNYCNLSCSFCSKDLREKREMTIDEFKMVIGKIKNYTDNIYLHVKGEPLLHSKLDEILTICDENDMNVRLTTNGTLLSKKKDILMKHNIKQINVSVHCENNISTYFTDVFNTCDELSNKTTIIYRIWVDKLFTNIVDKINNHYHLSTDIVDKIFKEKNIKIAKNIYLDKDNEFEWPKITNKKSDVGTCLGTKSHIAILSNGNVTPCCLDSDGVINLGNIFDTTLEEIMNSKRYIKMKTGFCNRKVTEELCKKCSFKDRLLTNK